MTALAAALLCLAGTHAPACAEVELDGKPLLPWRKRRYYETKVRSHLLIPDWLYHDAAFKQLVDKDEVFPETLELIRSAKKRIMFGMYLFGGDLGDQVIDELLNKQKAGVQVHMVLTKTRQSYKSALKQEVKILAELERARKAGNPVAKPPYRQKMSKAMAAGLPVVNAETKFIRAKAPVRVDHSKLIIVDGVEAIFGGMNFADTTAKNRDTMVRVAGPFVGELEKTFINNWRSAWVKDPRSIEPEYAETAARARMDARLKEAAYSRGEARLTVTAPYARNTRKELIKLFDAAKKYIYVEQLIFNDTKALKAVARAAKRGVKVRLLLDPAEHLYYRDWKGGPNNKAVALFQEMLRKSPKLDAEVRHFDVGPGQELHMKMCVIDGKIVGLGSTNFSSGAFNSNYELFTFMRGKGIVKDYVELFENDWNRRGKLPPPVKLDRKLISVFSDFIF